MVIHCRECILVLLALSSAAFARTLGPLPDECKELQGDFQRSIWEDLTPFAREGISAALMQRAMGESSAFRREGIGLLFKGGQLFVLDGTPDDHTVDGFSSVLTYVRVLEDISRRYGSLIPDAELVVNMRDYGDLQQTGRAAAEWAAARLPVFRFCRSDDDSDILIPIAHLYEKHLTGRFIDAIESANAKYPWAEKVERAYGHHSVTHRTIGRSSDRRDADGKALPAWAHSSPRLYMANNKAWAAEAAAAGAASGTAGAGDPAAAAAAAEAEQERDEEGGGWDNSSVLLINPRRRLDMADWAQFKYVVHIDGITCSSKLEQVLPLGSLLLKEESGWRSFYGRLLVPYEHYVPFWRTRPQACPPTRSHHPSIIHSSRRPPLPLNRVRAANSASLTAAANWQVPVSVLSSLGHGAQEILDAIAWARAHDAQAAAIASAAQRFSRRFLSTGALRCYWLILLREYAPLLRFEPGAREETKAIVPVEEWMGWVRRADNGTGAFWPRDVLEL